ncbi:ABC transporter ATP-binding protein [Gulosibacter sp. ACHW.36C]|uniref:Dipeptide/oligopeptide/nickel ABC transporter ATP-binding protein n=1 Tax=Gulosibacter sediminis TaxID=1729695 RepID=A0ABY4MWN6_9MICO|nr:dipeptide/oligopeptide/nickel ABC transporter ATP-binding protein [Gulosibacter sediminis]UQN14838.1 dipeptide/oligopeptide/nickel ABC transporter ATP-binding protein [Gulosibacter sediminis]
MSLLEINDLSVVFGRGQRRNVALDLVTLSVEPGETLGLVGESGSGKSTLASVALGLRAPTSGEVTFDGGPLTRRRLAGRMQAVLQQPVWALNPRMSIFSSVAEPLRVRTRDRSEVRRRVEEMLDAVALEPELQQRRPHELSGGQRQRVAIARALVTHPEFIVFDEAVSALDVSVQAQILQLIRKLQLEHGFAALFITHDMSVVQYIADEVCVLRSGEVVELARADAFAAGPQHPYSRSLLEER